MEQSSPLAAMQHPSLPFGLWGCRADAPTSNSCYGGKLNFGPKSFNFKDLSMTKASTDYFNLKPIRGSSPTASLAADLSQNFHIDQSPQLPTPRRALFSSNLFGTSNGRESVTTPPLPSSSPGPGNDSMDISPLPHKAPYVVTTHIELQPPTPEYTPTNGYMLSSPDVVAERSLEVLKQAVPSERRRSTLFRPSLSRTKGHSTNAMSMKAGGLDNQLPHFKFGSGPLLPSPSLMSLDECFVSSPPQEKKLHSTNLPMSIMGPPRLKQPFPGLHGHSRNNGPPIIGHVRKPSAPTQRPRKLFRRSLSMFEHPAEITKQQQPDFCPPGSLHSIMDIDDPHQLQLPHFNSDEESLPRITKDTMVDVLDGRYLDCYDHCMVIDCRFEYEYKGGHIDGALNFNDKEELSKQLFESSALSSTAPKILLIFHCEYSAHRAPIMAKYIRHRDRAANAHRYPRLTYPEAYILDGGYSSFFIDHRFRCSPQSYVEMADKEHANACERGLGRIKQQRGKLSRAQTFAFGQHSQHMDDSPTAPGRQCSALVTGMEIAIDQHLDTKRMFSRRMVSY